MRSLRFRECGLYEASDLLLGDHLTEKSTTVKWIDVTLPQSRQHRLKDHRLLQDMAIHEPDSDDIFEKGLLDAHYPKRPASLEEVCLYDFVANYDWQSKDVHGDRKYSKLRKPRLPNHKLFDPQKENQRENYFYSLLLLFVPFRDESSLILENETAELAFQRLMNVHSSAYHAKLQTILGAQSKIKEINEARQADGVEQKLSKDDNNPQLPGEAKSAMHDLIDMMTTNSSDQLGLDERVTMLNVDQRRIYDRVMNHLHHHKQHDDGDCHCDIKPLRLFVSGVGGTGKSFLIEAIKLLVHRIWESKELTVVVAAPTGLAAFNVGGLTIHRLFQLPIEHEGQMAGYWSLPKVSQKVMKPKLCRVKLIIIDEISMVSSLNLAYIHLRLEELFGGDEWFGSINMLFVGDILQLQPVNGSAVFENITKKTLLLKLGCAASINIWRDSVTYDELTINERQKSDAEFADILDCVRRGCPTDKTNATLQQRVIQGSITDKFEELCRVGQTPLCLLPTSNMCKQFNKEMLEKLGSELQELVCVDEVDQTSSTRKWSKKAAEQLEKLNNDCNMTAGLQAKLVFAIGARVMLRRNIDTSIGLVNGAIGTVLSISKEQIKVKFYHISAPYDVERVHSKFMVMKNFYVYRQQFPLILAYAITIHKSQGLSLDCTIVDLSDRVFSAGMAYVELSRVRSLAGLHLSAFHHKSIIVSTSCLKEVNRLRGIFRKDLPQYQLPKQTATTCRKRKLTGSNSGNPQKILRIAQTTSESLLKKPARPRKRPKIKQCDDDRPKKKLRTCVIATNTTQRRIRSWPFRFNPVNEEWQRNSCAIMGLQFVAASGLNTGGPEVTLTRPRTRHSIQGDGNCLFRTLSFIITGSEEQHTLVREAILHHMLQIAHFM